jgi:hypothetical protein
MNSASAKSIKKWLCSKAKKSPPPNRLEKEPKNISAVPKKYVPVHIKPFSATSVMTLSNQSEFPTFFCPQQDNLKISRRILPNPTIPEDDLPTLA